MWVISIDTMIASNYGDNIYASRITFRGSCPSFLLTPLERSNSQSTPIPHQCFSSRYNLAQFSIFTTLPVHSYPSVSKTNTSPTSPFIHCFATSPNESSIGSDLAIIHITHLPPEPQLHPSSFMFDGWFGVSFPDGDNITHVSRPHSLELLQLYSFPPSVVRSLSPLPVSLQRSICLHVFPFQTVAALAHSIVCDIVSPSSRSPNTSFLPISHCFAIRPAPTNST